MATMRKAFTIIEILVSVLIISVSIVFILKIYNDNRSHILYLTERNKHALGDSLFLGKEVIEHHRDTISAYALLHDHIKVQNSKSKEILKKLEREIFIPEEIVITPPPDTPGPTATVQEIKIKGQYPAFYRHFEITRF